MVTQRTIELATMGWADSLILMVLALVVFGPRRLPQIGRQIGKLMYEFRKASNDFKFQMEEELRNAEEADRRKRDEERQRTLALAAPAQQTVDSQPDSQVSESRLGAPADGTVANTPETTSWEAAAYPPAIEPAADSPADDSYPCIQPPATGEQVPAAKPWSLEAELAKVSGAADGNGTAPTAQPAAATAASAAAEEQAPAAAETGAAEETASSTEQVRHG